MKYNPRAMGFHAPTTYFPLLIPECLLIELTETEDKQTLDDFINALSEIQQEANENILLRVLSIVN